MLKIYTPVKNIMPGGSKVKSGKALTLFRIFDSNA